MLIRRLFLFCIGLALCIFSLPAAIANHSFDEREDILKKMDERAEYFGELSRRIWEFAEVGYKETNSSALLKAELRAAGFQIQENVAEIPTAFVATYGQGKPVIGILGEYDALPGLSQVAFVAEKRPRVAGGPGHGCGHNLFGTASAFAAITLKDYLAEKKISGTIKFYGTPAEEGGSGKVFMARAGVFNDLDVALAWHPGDANSASLKSSLANVTAKFRFYGQAAHAAAAPDKGRSALDAVMLMTHAVELMREHVPQTTRLHYIITKGGEAPNVVPDFAEVYMYARHPSMPVLDGIWSRVVKCADAGALATETKMEMELVGSVYNELPNEPLAKLIDKNLRQVGGVKYTSEETTFAEKLRTTFSLEGALSVGSQEQVQGMEDGVSSGSTDVSDVSWIVPTSEFRAATYVPGTPGHSWQAVACTGSNIGRKGLTVAAKTLALSGIDLLNDPKLIEEAKADFNKRRAGHEYRSRIPANQKPALNYRDK
ncbi:MAG: amidohydrolase [Acidobacteria bacterium]|nr:amidohydrolase [Acidobacteriota bacterium]